MSDNNFVVKTENLTKTYQVGEIEVQALRGAALQVQRGEFLAIMRSPADGWRLRLAGIAQSVANRKAEQHAFDPCKIEMIW